MPTLAYGLGIGFQRGPSGGGGSIFSPADLSLLFWLDANQLGLSNNAAVAEFTDYSGNARHFVQSTLDNRTLFKTSGINGIGAVEGDGANDSMTLAAFGEQETWWGFIVFQPVTVNASKSLWALADYPDTAVDYKVIESPGGLTSLNLNQNAGFFTTPLSVANGVTVALLLKGSPSAMSYLADDGSTDSIVGLGGTQPNSGSLPNNAMRLFGRGDGQSFNVRIGEVVLGSGTLATEDEDDLWNYAAEKWGTDIP